MVRTSPRITLFGAHLLNRAKELPFWKDMEGNLRLVYKETVSFLILETYFHPICGLLPAQILREVTRVIMGVEWG